MKVIKYTWSIYMYSNFNNNIKINESDTAKIYLVQQLNMLKIF